METSKLPCGRVLRKKTGSEISHVHSLSPAMSETCITWLVNYGSIFNLPNYLHYAVIPSFPFHYRVRRAKSDKGKSQVDLGDSQ